MAPKYSRPGAPVPASWPRGPAYAETTPASTAVGPALPWQEFYVDPRLRQVISLALTNNRDLRLAALNVERARAMYGIRRAELLPHVDVTGRGSKQRVPADLSSTGTRQTAERWDVNLGVASWEIDLFGRIRSLKDRALQEYLASGEARRGVQILLVSGVAQAYLAMAADQDNLELSATTLQSQEAAYALVRHRYDLGLVPELEVFRARTPLEVARRDEAVYRQRVATGRNALDLLAGTPVPEELLPSSLGGFSVRELAPGLPSEVLLARPDVLEAEHLLIAANADIGAARAAFFPRVSLTASFGTASSDLSGLFKSGSGAWSYAPEIVMPIFDARTWSAHAAAKVQREQALVGYEGTVQKAFREVADSLAVRGTVGDAVSAQESLVNALEAAYRIAGSRFERGIDSYLSVLDAQRSLFAAQQALVQLRYERLANDVRLFAALGGG